jgi:ribosomal protein S18 acetylase RimI-like enzyme
LLEDGIQLAKTDNLPIFLHSVPAAVNLYRKAGFTELERISMEFGERDERGKTTGQGLIELVAMSLEP